MFEWINKKIKKCVWYDISLVKLSTAAFILLVAKLWTPILSLDWYWYLAISLIAAIRPMYKMFS
ncbi:hypothetical protein ISS05_04415 [Candidatus Woesearchaeota archaeon]|nr:hypothetical protein [Candidatus Woesearchaeota archaeon]